MINRITITFGLIFFVALASAHEFWLLPKKFRFAVGEEMSVSFMVGENFEGEPWNLQKHKVEKLELHQLAKAKDIRALVKPEEKEKLKIKFIEEGTHLVVMQSNYAFIELEAEKFNDYLKQDDLDNALEQRKNTNTLNKPAKEFYARFTKLLVQVGNKTDNTFKKRVGLKNEIVPDQNPYTLKSGDYLQCTVFYEGKPSPHQLVKVWNKIGTTTFLQNLYTENDGTVKFPINSKGPWMVSSVKMIPSEKEGADWQSMWASLVFGIE
jgi:uncharacterized GH25 family protein